MDEFLKNLEALSIEELEHVISDAQMLIQKKQQEAIRLAELEKQRKEQERLEAERKKQEEIAALQKRLRELQGDAQEDGQPDTSVNFTMPEPEKEQPEAAPQEQGYSMISCPQCHKLVPSDSRFCFYCGSDTTQRKEAKSEDFADVFSSTFSSASQGQASTLCPNCGTPVPSGSQFCQNCGKPIGNADQANPQQNISQKTVAYADDSMKKWDTLAGEGEILGWKEINISQPEKKPFADIKITTKRILISVEGRMQRGLRNSGGLLVYAATAGMEKGKPWAMIPLECITAFSLYNKEIRIRADELFIFRSSKAKEIYVALQQVLPEKAK